MTLFPILPIAVEPSEVGAVSGAIGRLRLLPISDLRVDPVFQRNFSAGGVRNVRKIIKEFDWDKFLPVIVADLGDGTWSVIDGQHRATAAATIGITDVPCYVLSCTPARAAAAFAAINGNVTAMTPQDLWFAKLAAGDPESVELQAVLDAASVRVVRKKDGMGVGETRSINVLQRAFQRHGGALLTTALQCITECGDGNPGMIVGSVVNGIIKSIATKPELLAEPSQLFDAVDDWPISEVIDAAKIEHARTKNPVQHIVTRELNQRLSRRRAAA